jgi:CRISPR type IV-associated protein Csf1
MMGQLRDATNLLVEHLSRKGGTRIGLCAICGAENQAGLPIKKAVSSNFNDWRYMKYDSNSICCNCAACLDSSALDGKALRNYSFIATESELRILSHSDIAQSIMNPPEPPFVFVVTFTHKKHAFWEACINKNRDRFVVATETGSVKIERGEFTEQYKLCQRLYDAGFSKEEIRMGNYRKWIAIESFPDFFDVEDKIKDIRGILGFEFLVNILQKGEANK